MTYASALSAPLARVLTWTELPRALESMAAMQTDSMPADTVGHDALRDSFSR